MLTLLFFFCAEGFMLVPSDFPGWLKWTNKIAFHTYAWRTFMYNEFHGNEYNSTIFQQGDQVLSTYEIEDVEPSEDVSLTLSVLFAPSLYFFL